MKHSEIHVNQHLPVGILFNTIAANERDLAVGQTCQGDVKTCCGKGIYKVL